MNHLFLCVECESIHFLVRWDQVGHVWTICCEGCGAIYNLQPTGMAEVRRKRVDQS
jgi:hypothetical protein